jgi:hypothetical protein
MKKTDNEIISILNREIRASSGYIGGEIVSRRRKSLEYYLGKPFGNEIEGRSQVISTDVSDTVESLMPSLMKIFTAGDNVFNCEPVGPEDEQVAKQASDYINHVFYKENRGFEVLYTAFKDALIQKNGILKVYWDDSQKTTREEYKKLTDDEFNLLVSDPEVKVSQHTEYEEEFKDDNDKVIDTITLHDCVIHKTVGYGQVRIEPIPPEEFLIERRAKSIESANFVCHRVNMTKTQLIEMGYDRDVIEKMPVGDHEYYLEDRQTRHQETDFSAPQDRGDATTDEVLIHECYIKMDIDDDGKAELVKVARSGVTKVAQGLQSDSLNTETATGMNQVLTQSQMRMELIARTFAETGVKDLGIKIFELLCKYQQKEKLVRIRGEFVPMTPYEWRDRVNLSVKVGLGTGSKEQQLILLNSILQRQLQAIQLQGNVYGPVVNLKNIYATLQKLIENAGLGNAEPFFMDPEVGAAQMPPLPPPAPTEFEKVSLAQVQGENERAVLSSQVETKKMESE